MNSILTFIRKKAKSLSNNNIAKSVLIISSGAMMTQALSFLFSPIITRIYPPEEYGVMSLFASTISILSVITSLKYEVALPIEKDEKKAKSLFVSCLIILSIFTLTLFLVIQIFGYNLFSLFQAERLFDYKFLLIVGVFFYGFREILMNWYYRKKDFKFISSSRVSQNLLGNSSKVLLGLLNFGVPGLLIGQVIKETFSVFPFFRKILKSENMFDDFSIKKSYQVIKEYKNYPFYQTPSSFLNVVKNQLPVFSLAFYGSSVVGLYGLANTVVKIPMTLLGNSVRNVFFAEAASIGKENPVGLKKLSNQIFNKLIIIGIFPLILLILFGPFLFTLIFGSNWTQAGQFSRLLALSVYANFVFSPASRVYQILDRQRVKLLIDIFGLLIVLGSFWIARILSPSPNLAILFYSISIFIYYLVIFIISKILVNVEIDRQ